MRALPLVILGVFGLAAGGCSSKHPAAASSCSAVDGTYELTVSATGQSESISGGCPDAGTPQVVDVTIAQGQVSLAGETCTLCASDGCILDIVCGDRVSCPGTAQPPASPPDTYVQALTFVVPAADASTSNAVVSFGANDCSFYGTAVLKAP
jgi:hypothetical protein